jgi:MoxR-like ATPase
MSFHAFRGHGPLQRPEGAAPIDPLRDPGGYRAGEGLANAVNVALALRMPLLVTGEPGTGKTQLAYRLAAELGLGEVLRFDTKSSSVAHELFYQFDSIRQFAQSQLHATAGRELPPAREFLRLSALGLAIVRTHAPELVRDRLGAAQAHEQPQRSLVLIDEIDKAPRDFPNDLLNQIENLEFALPELGQHWRADPALAPVVVISSNSEKQLPEPFLRRCVYHHIEFPKDHDELQEILGARLARLPLKGPGFDQALALFFKVRGDGGFEKKPSTSELLDWLRVLAAAGLDAARPLAEQKDLVLSTLGSLLKTRADLERGPSLLN